ncbi:hypothetical protein J4Q44_G00125550 [Coregonus suidteri]|uniref:Uncharacterized protein n=1 Tax=Coregonus suidteri TaxID=861788 RepID=A0AAN8M2G1_9TELE
MRIDEFDELQEDSTIDESSIRIVQVVVLADPNASSASSINITVTPITSYVPSQFTSLQPVAMGHLTASDHRPFTLDSSILTVTFNAVTGSAMLHNGPTELTVETVGPGGGGTGPQSVTHFSNLTTFVNPMGQPLEARTLAWKPVRQAEGVQVNPVVEGAPGDAQDSETQSRLDKPRQHSSSSRPTQHSRCSATRLERGGAGHLTVLVKDSG